MRALSLLSRCSLSAAVFSLCVIAGCGDDEAPPATVDVVGGGTTGGGIEPENAAGIPGATTFEIPAPARWLTQSDDGQVWILLEDGQFGRLMPGDTFEGAVSLSQSLDDELEVVHPPPAISRNGDIVLAEALLDGRADQCRDTGSLRWFDPTTGDVSLRELQEAPASPFTVTAEGVALVPTIEYEWDFFNDPPICLKGQPEHIRLSAYSKEQGLLWSLTSERLPGPPTIDSANNAAYYSDGHRSIVAVDTSAVGFGSKLWTATLSLTGNVQVSDPARDKAGALFVTGAKTVARIDSDGTVAWEVETESGDALSGQPVLGPSGLVLVAGTLDTGVTGERRWTLFALTKEGEALEQQSVETGHLHAPNFRQSGLTVLGTGDRLSLVPPVAGEGQKRGQLVIWRQSGGPARFPDFRETAPLVLSDGTLLAAWKDNRILRTSLGTTGLADTGWPRIQGSNRWDGQNP